MGDRKRRKGKQPTVLLADHNQKRIDNITAMLDGQYQIMTADRFGAAKAAMHANAIAAVLIYLDQEGMQLLQYIRTLKHQVAVIVLEPRDMDVTPEAVELELGALNRIKVPVKKEKLLGSLSGLIMTGKQLAEEQRHQIHDFDELTGVFLRRRFQIETAAMLKAHPRTSFIMVHFDIDRFRLFNSSMGEEEGNRLIKYEADIVRYVAAGYDFSTYCRVGGDQFILCHPENQGQIETDAEIIAKLLGSYRSDYFMEPTFGIYHIDDRSVPVESMMVRSLMAAKQSKHLYHHYIGVYDREMDNAISNEVFVENEMQNAMVQEEFQVYFQPKIDPRTNRACGAEALVRWLHPQRGMIMPGQFIPLFERNGFITQLDWYMWQHTAEYLHAWIQAGYDPDPVSVNISRVSLYNGNLVSQLNQLLAHYKIKRSLFQLELTESTYMSNPEMMKVRINELHKAGYTILMDDFGSSYSSLNTLRDIDVDWLKMDMKFLPQHFNKKEEKAFIIVSAVMNMADKLGMEVIAEGVETKQQRDFLKTTTCKLVQGYYYEKPIPAEDYTRKYVVNLHT
ncbi:MAG: EAL domain-containing protein [Solobacterium sp.]|nr:EAL domain-containing protein [Solobacterium sp.]